MEELAEKLAKATWLSKTLERAVKLELVLKKELLQSGCELAPEDATQRGDGQEESSRGGDPSGTVGCKTARKEGDDSNAEYWYRRAHKTSSRASLEQEWTEIAEALLRAAS